MKREMGSGDLVSQGLGFQTRQDFPGHPVARLYLASGGHLKDTPSPLTDL